MYISMLLALFCRTLLVSVLDVLFDIRVKAFEWTDEGRPSVSGHYDNRLFCHGTMEWIHRPSWQADDTGSENPEVRQCFPSRSDFNWKTHLAVERMRGGDSIPSYRMNMVNPHCMEKDDFAKPQTDLLHHRCQDVMRLFHPDGVPVGT